jgi:hypothetical protein
MKRILFVFVAVFGFCGCASSYVPTAEHKADVESRLRAADAGIGMAPGTNRVARYPLGVQ